MASSAVCTPRRCPSTRPGHRKGRGYADQAHLAREWKTLPGCSVGTWLREEFPLWPSVGFSDVDAGVRLLTRGLGFVVTALYRGDDGTVEHAEARWPDGGGVMFGSRGKPDEWRALGPQGVYVVAAEPATVDAAWDRVRRLDGVADIRELHDTDYGSHQFDIRDADGNLWTQLPSSGPRWSRRCT